MRGRSEALRVEARIRQRHARRRERHRRAASHAAQLAACQVVARLEAFDFAGEAPAQRDASNASTGEMPLVPASSARKNAVRPSPIELTTPTPVTKTRGSTNHRYLARRCTCEQRRCGAKSASRDSRYARGAVPCADPSIAVEPRGHHAVARRPDPGRCGSASRARSRAGLRLRPAGRHRALLLVPGHLDRGRAAGLAAGGEGLRKGDRLAIVDPGGRRVRPLLSGCALRRGGARADLSAALVQERRGYHDTVAHIVRASRRGDAADHGGDAAVRRTGPDPRREAARDRHGRRARGRGWRHRRPRCPRTTSRSCSSRAAARRARRASWSRTATSPRTPRPS